MNKEKSIIVQIKRICVEVEKLSGNRLQSYELTHTQFTTMKYIYQNAQTPIRQIDIERHFSLTNPTVTGILQNLEKKGMIERLQNPEDSRSKIIKATEKAEDMKADLMRFGDELENDVTKKLTTEEKEQLNYLLKKLRM